MINVSIIMPCYNAGPYVEKAIKSVQNQSYNDWELLIIDDGSTDNSAEIAQQFATTDNRIKLIRQPNSGACRARNNGIEHAQGDYVKFLDADDILEPNCLSEQVEQIGTLNARQIPFGDYYNIDQEGNIISEYIFNKQEELSTDPVCFFFYEWRILISSPLHRTALLREIDGFNERLKRGQESDMHLRLALVGVEFLYNPCKTFRYRDHQAGTRISEKYKEGTKERIEASYYRAHVCEELLKNKYDNVPIKYHSYFTNIWFSYARDLFAAGNKKDGIEYLSKAQAYGLRNHFQKFYIKFGMLIGYISLENIFQLRLKLLHKK